MTDSLRALLALAVCSALSACRHASPDAAASQRGEQIFGTVCAKCHGLDGKGGLPSGSANAPRNFCDAAFQASRTDAELKQTIRNGKGAMPGFGNLFSDSELQGLVRKLRSFGR